jgi:nucleoside 2-deoxyribosyltransferase
MYTEKTFMDVNYVYNGPWILRPPVSEDEFSLNQLPSNLKPIHIWDMVKKKIESSDVVLGVINSKAYGTIAEIGYACHHKGIAVYVLPDQNVSEDELQDLWFLFQIAKTTEYLWSNDDIEKISEFSALGITSLQEYKDFLDNIVPNFLKK